MVEMRQKGRVEGRDWGQSEGKMNGESSIGNRTQTRRIGTCSIYCFVLF